MKPNFPLKNITIHELIGLRKPGFIQGYTEYIRTGDANYDHHHKQRMEILEEEFKQMDEEINQVLHTSNAATKRTLFSELKQNISDFGLLTVNEQHIFQMAMQWNRETADEFEKKISQKTTEYFSQKERTQYKHLEVYTVPNTVPASLRLGGGRDFVSYTNHNFFCIEDYPDLIDYDSIPSYITFITSITERFKRIVIPFFEQYEADSKPESENKEPLYDRYLNKLKNNRVIAVLMVVGVITMGVFTFLAPFREMISTPETLVFSAIKQKTDSSNSILDVYLRNRSGEDVIIHNIELIVTEKTVDTSTITLPIGPILGGSATYDYLVNMTDSIYLKDVSHLVKGKSAERIFFIVALGNLDKAEDLIRGETNSGGDVINDVDIKGILRITFNENQKLVSEPFSIRIKSKGNNDLIAKNGITLDAYKKLLDSDEFIEAYHGIDLISLTGGEEAIGILKQFRRKDLSYLKKKYESTYVEIEDEEVLEVPIYQLTPEEKYHEFVAYLDQKIKALESAK